jgi:hypothetical protein
MKETRVSGLNGKTRNSNVKEREASENRGTRGGGERVVEESSIKFGDDGSELNWPLTIFHICI